MHSKFHLHMREELLYCDVNRALEQVAQRGCGVSLTGDTQEPFGGNPVPCGLGWHCLTRVAGIDDPLWSLTTLPILSFCELISLPYTSSVKISFSHFIEIKLSTKGAETLLHSKSQQYEIVKITVCWGCDTACLAYVSKTLSLPTHSAHKLRLKQESLYLVLTVYLHSGKFK